MWISGQKYGVINSIVLSRSGESDNVYLRDEESVTQNGLTEVKIVDNQIMNFNNRSDYLQGILNALNGLYYYLNDFNSTGILYYEVGDLYNVQIGENTYQCLMLNDEVNVTTGIEEIIHTDMPEKSETDYSKADKTDRRINQTYLIVDKQNQEIEAVVKQTVDPTNPESTVNKVSRLNIRVGELESSIKDIADITTYGESQIAVVNLSDINESEPIMLKVKPITKNISKLYPKGNLYPSNNQYLDTRIVNFKRTYTEEGVTKTEDIPYELPDDLLYYDSNNYDEFYLDYDSQTCQITKKCEYFGGSGTNLFNPDYFDGIISGIDDISISNDERFIIRSNGSSPINQIELYNHFNITIGGQLLAFYNLNNIEESQITTTVKYYNNSGTLVYTSEFNGNRVLIETPSGATYFTLTFYFDGLYHPENAYSFNLMLNTDNTERPYETYYTIIKLLENAQVIEYPYPSILLKDGNYEISLVGYDIGYLFVRLMAQNIYTTQFYTKFETNSQINQKANEITSTVSQTYETKDNAQTNYSQLQQTATSISATVENNNTKANIIAKINDNTSTAQIEADNINLSGKTINISANGVLGISSENFSVNTNGDITANSGKMGGWTLSSTGLINEDGNLYIRNSGYSSIYTFADMVIMRNFLLGKIDLSDDEQKHYDLNNDGKIDSMDLYIMRTRILGID